jgi:Outer membrane protein beta-barrel domain
MALRTIIALCVLLAALEVHTPAQEKRIEISATVGYTFSNTIPADDILFGDGSRIIDEVGPKSGFSWGFQGDYYITNRIAAGFLWNRQQSNLRFEFPFYDSIDFTDMSVDNYHGVITYHFANKDSNFRPFVFGGFGATRYNPRTIGDISFEDEVEFSTTWGGGLKFYPVSKVGFKLGVRWTPTHIRTDPSGIFCNPRFGCWVISTWVYSNQVELGTGILFRF